MNNIAYSYVRFSTGEQAKGDSERRQNANFEACCKRRGLTPAADSFTDRGRSGFKGEHLNDTGELRRFLRLVESGEIEPGSTLVVESLDRLGRQDVEEAFGVFSSILGAGIRIVTMGKGEGEREYVKGGGMVPLIMSILEMSRAHGESQRKSELVGAAYENKRDSARKYMQPMGKTCPLWLRLKQGWRDYATHGSAYDEIPERADVVRRIFQLAIEGYGKGVIANKLNEERIPSFKDDNEKLKAKGLYGWGASSVDKVLKNKAVFGEYQPMTVQGAPKGKRVKAGDPIPGYFPAVVSTETFFEAQAAIDGRRTAKATKQSAKFNIWQGVAKCERCGGALHVVNKGAPPKGGAYLRCCNIRKGFCKAKSVRLEHAEEVFRGMIIRLDALALVKDSSAQIEKTLKATEGKLSEAQKRLRALEVQLIEFSDSPAIGRAVVRVEGEVNSLEQELDALKAELAAEQSIGWDEFLSRLDLVSYEGRAKANNLLKRLGVVVLVGTSGYTVTEGGRPVFVMDYREGEAGYLMRGLGRGLPTFVPLSEIPKLSASEEAYDALEDEGQMVGEY
jgi:DNA invertase Pin-like site-specific DNA recombinase